MTELDEGPALTAGAPEASDDAREIELKLQAPAEALPLVAARLKADAGAKLSGRATRLVSVYFDDERFSLREAGLSLRIRREGRKRVQTLKRGGADAGLFDRTEIERRATADVPTLDANETALMTAALGEAGVAPESWRPAFTTVNLRTIFLVERDGAAIEVALDDAAVEIDGRRAAFCEVELELLSGRPSALFAVARDLAAATPLRISVLSKSARGYALIEGDGKQAFQAGPSPVRAEMTVEQAFRAIAADCVGQFRLNEDALLETPAPEAIHQARVALRRLRSAFTLFKPVVSDGRSAGVLAGLKRLAGALGDARDLDVQIADFEAVTDETDERRALSAVLGERRDAAYLAALETLRSPASREVMLDLTEWLALGDWRRREDTAALRRTPITDFAADLLERRLKRVLKRGRKLEALSPEKRHEVRIEAKKLRYADGFFAPLFAEKRARRTKAFGKRLKALQDELGGLNDIATAHGLMRTAADAAADVGDGAAAFAAGRRSAEADAAAPGLLKKAARSLEKLRKGKTYW